MNQPEWAIAKLRKTLHQLERTDTEVAWFLSTGFVVLDGYLPDTGLPSHSVHELVGTQIYGFALRLLSQLDEGCYCLWCRMASSRDQPYGPALKDFGVAVENIIFVECQSNKDLLWAMEEGLRSGSVAVIIGEPKGHLNLTSSRRLQLAAETGGCLGLVLNTDQQANLPHNALFSRWHIDSSPTQLSEKFAWNVELLRMRGVKPMGWRVTEAGFHD